MSNKLSSKPSKKDRPRSTGNDPRKKKEKKARNMLKNSVVIKA